MPPSRRRPPPSSGATPPVRRPRVAGLRHRPAGHHDEETTESVSGTLDVEQPAEVEQTAQLGRIEPDEPAAADAAGEEDREAAWTEPVADVDLGTDTVDDTESEAGEPAPKPRSRPAGAAGRRPAGKRRSTGTTRPADLSAAEAATTEASRATRAVSLPRRKANPLPVAIVLVVVAVVLAGLAFWFRGEADTLESADSNTALTDSATTSEVTGQLTTAIEDTFSYNYTDLASTQKAVDAVLTGKARCEYDQLFGQVKELAPKQKIIIATAVRDIALVRLDGDRAEALVFIDQSSTRVDNNKSVAGEAQFNILARRDGDTWKITEFNMFDQPMVNGQPAPKC